jgi:hypothetical protein
MRTKLTLSVLTIFVFSLMALAQGGRGNAEATVKGKTIKINYGRPALAGRDMLAQARTGMVWRLGMNEATEIESTGDLTVGGKDLKAGKYSLWAKKTGDNSWTLNFHPTVGVWGAPELTSGFVAEIPLTVSRAQSTAEQLTINLAEREGSAALTIHWGTTQLSGSLGVK